MLPRVFVSFFEVPHGSTTTPPVSPDQTTHPSLRPVRQVALKGTTALAKANVLKAKPRTCEVGDPVLAFLPEDQATRDSGPVSTGVRYGVRLRWVRDGFCSGGCQAVLCVSFKAWLGLAKLGFSMHGLVWQYCLFEGHGPGAFPKPRN